MRIASLCRHLFGAGVVLALISAGQVAAPAQQVTVETPSGQGKSLRDLLDKPVNFTSVADWTLKDALEFLIDKYHVSIQVDTFAFKAKKLDNVLDVNIARGDGWKTEEAPLKEVLRKILNKVPLDDSFASYVVLGKVILITTDEMAIYRWMRQLVSLECDKASLSSVLKKLATETGTNLVIDPRAVKEGQAPLTLQLKDVTLETAVCLLAEMTELKPVRVGNVLFLTTKANAAEMLADKDRAVLIAPCPLPAEPKIPPP